MKDWVSIDEAARLLSVSTKTIQRRIKDGTFKTRKNGKVREVLTRTLGIKQENDTAESVQSTNSVNFETMDFMQEIIRNQQKHIESQDERISEVNKLILGIQGQVTQMNQNLQLMASNQEERHLSQNNLPEEQSSTTNRISKDETKTNHRDNNGEWHQIGHLDRYQNIYLGVVIVLAIGIFGLILWQIIAR